MVSNTDYLLGKKGFAKKKQLITIVGRIFFFKVSYEKKRSRSKEKNMSLSKLEKHHLAVVFCINYLIAPLHLCSKTKTSS